MSRGFHVCVSLVVCACFILSTLFLNTLQVKAYYEPEPVQIQNTVQFILNPSDIDYIADGGTLTIERVTGTSSQQGISLTENGTYSGDQGGTGNISSTGSFAFTGPETGRVSSSGSGTASAQSFYTGTITGTISNSSSSVNSIYELDFEVPVIPYDDTLLASNFDSNYPYVYVAGWGLTASSSLGNVTGYSLNYNNGEFGVTSYVDKRVIGRGRYYTPTFIFKGHLSYVGSSTSTLTFNVNLSYTYKTRDATLEEASRSGNIVKDVSANQKLDDLNQSSQAIEESVTSDTGGGLLATIKNFFGSFFQNVFDTLVSVFVPEDGFFSDWFDRLNTLLSEKLGMLYAPFDLLITTLNAIMNANTTDNGIPFPGIQWEDTYLVEPFTFYFSSLGDTFTDLQGYVYFATDTVLLFAFLYLLQNKIRLILEGHESG